jgi:molybdenum cofactor cytidylyltransferase
MEIVAVLLAAGDSERMGAPKALLPWRGQSLLRHQLQQIQKSSVRECVTVLGRDADRLAPMVSNWMRPTWKSRAVFNPRHSEGKSASIRAGLTSLCTRPDGILIAAVDQPLDHRLVNALISRATEEWERGAAVGRRTILIPTFAGRRGHPPLFSGSLIGELMGISEESQGLRAVVRRDAGRVFEVSWRSDEIFLNLNSPVDLEPARARNDLQTP